MCVRRVRAPSSEGTVPVSWFVERPLRAVGGQRAHTRINKEGEEVGHARSGNKQAIC